MKNIHPWTEALVRAMETRVEVLVCLGHWGEVILDIGVLTSYSGEGQCRVIECYDDTATRYKNQLRAWAHSRGWRVTKDEEDEEQYVHILLIERI